MEVKETPNNWYALFTMTGEEEKVRERLQYRLKEKDLKVVIPKRKLRERKDGIWRQKIRTLFPGYIFLYGLMNMEDYYLLKNVPGLIKVLKNDNEPCIIDEREIRVIGTLIKDSEIIEPSSAIIEGGQVIIKDGPLLGLEGMIICVNKRKGRVKVKMGFQGQEKIVELAISLLDVR